MPEHGPGTPARWRMLESFLWHDLSGPDDWAGWAGRLLPRTGGPAVEAGLADAMRLHASLRALQAVNSEIADGADMARVTLNHLVAGHGIRPHLNRRCALRLVPADDSDAVAPLLVQALEAMQADAWRRFKLCREPSCRASFFDASRAATRTWCAMRTCGSRNKMRRYRSNA